MQFISKTIPAGGAAMETTRGLCLSVKSCTFPVTYALNGGPPLSVKSGSVIDERASGEWRSINFVNPNAVAVTLTYFVGDVPVQYMPDDNQQKTGKTYTTSQVFNALSKTVKQTITNAHQGHQRKDIVITVDGQIGSPGANDGAVIFNLDGSVFAFVTKTTPLIFETDAAFKILRSDDSPANLTVYVGEIYFNEGAG